MNKQAVFFRKSNGFTLVEVLVVMLILMALSSITLDFTKEFAFQGRYEVTVDRYDKLKRAIIGRPDVLINGQPDISGFVADMGRLPRNIQELLVQNYCDDDYRISDNTPDNNGLVGTTASDTPEVWCTSETATLGGVWITQSTNWKGPYLTTKNPDYKPNAFSDGWGNQATVLTDHNYGWNFTGTDSNSDGFFEDLTIQSYGKDQVAGGTEYNADYPIAQPAIRENDWLININNGIAMKVQAPVANISCDVTTLLTKPACEGAGQLWFPASRCENTTIQTSCATSPLIWDSVYSVCFDVSKDITSCTDLNDTWNVRAAKCELFDGASCVLPSFTWDSGTLECISNSKQFCELYITTPTGFNTQDIDLEITYFDGLGSSQISTTTVTLEENGLYQNIVFNPAISVSQGEITVNIFKTGTSHIYPPSCSGLENDTAPSDQSDCQKAGGTLLSNGLCDDITIAECETGADGTAGKLIRNTQKLLIVPHKNIGTINW